MIRIETSLESWELIEPFATARDCVTHLPVLLVTLTDAEGRRGRGEAAGVDYDGESPETMARQVESLRGALHEDMTGADLLGMLPAGGARNALDCALWDLWARRAGQPVWKLAGLEVPRPVTTAYTLGLGDETDTRRQARAARNYPIIKLKVDADRHLDRVQIVLEEHPAARVLVDANQAWSPDLLLRLLPELRALGVELVEQPLPRGEDSALEGLPALLPIAADESCTDRASLAALARRYQYVNLKLDKCGGLTEAFAMCDEARRLGLGLMVGNMCGTSLAMAPALLVAQRCRYVDLDGPLLQRHDREHAIRYEAGGSMHPPTPALWG